jgi:hypothetical protein
MNPFLAVVTPCAHDTFAVRYPNFYLPQQVHYLLRCMLFPSCHR